MDIYCLHDEVQTYHQPKDEESKYRWLVYWYEGDSYDGRGEGVALGYDGLLYVYPLGHCSCWGPFDGFGCHSGGITIDQYFEGEDEVTDNHSQEVREVVKKLLLL